MTITKTKERPIIFSGDMVKALLAGRKTQTRRVMKGFWKPINDLPASIHPDGAGSGWIAWWPDPVSAVETARIYPGPVGFQCPYGRVGDHLWVRETCEYADHSTLSKPAGIYRADRDDNGGIAWRSPIFMPRELSRLTLVITDVRVERVQEISEADAIAEGFDVKTSAAALRIAAGKIQPADAFNVEDDEGDLHDGWLCKACADKLATADTYTGWGCCPEDDGPALCDQCHRPLLVSLSTYGIERELRIEEDPQGREPACFPCKGADAAIAHMIADGIGDLREKHHGRLGQIGFATKWDALNAARGFPWSSNPWVWALTFKVLPAREGEEQCDE